MVYVYILKLLTKSHRLVLMLAWSSHPSCPYGLLLALPFAVIQLKTIKICLSINDTIYRRKVNISLYLRQRHYCLVFQYDVMQDLVRNIRKVTVRLSLLFQSFSTFGNIPKRWQTHPDWNNGQCYGIV